MILPTELGKHRPGIAGYLSIYVYPDGTGDLLLVRARAIESGNSDTL